MRPYSYFILTVLLTPMIIISEPPQIPLKSTTAPVAILFTGVTPLDQDPSVVLHVGGEMLSTASSPCQEVHSVKSAVDTTSVIEWKASDKCKIPLVTVNKKNYLLPVNGYYPDDATLADMSTETLENTLKAGSIINSDYRLASLHVRKFFTSIEQVLASRNTPFAYPIPGAPLPTTATRLPNSARPYRADSTDGIHHGFDFYVSKGTPVRAIDDGVIIHVKRDFSWNEMDHLLPGHTDLEEQENLDVYRGNTVYVKTKAGDVGIYAHLNNIPDNIEVGTLVKRGEIVGHVGDSAVPDKKYLYHLHFELALNPHKDEKVGTYDFSDILLWSFWGKGKTVEWMKAHGKELFQ